MLDAHSESDSRLIPVEVLDDGRFNLGQPWTPTAFNTYISCPLRYWWRFRQGWKPPATIPTTVGNLVHAILELLLADESSHRSIDRAQELCDAEIARWLETAPSAELIAEVPSEVEARLHTYLLLEDPADVAVIPGGLEMELQGTIAGQNFVGRADVVLHDLNGIIVRDYKTGADRPEYAESYWRQQAIYGILLGEVGIDVSEVELLYLGNPSGSRRRVFTEAFRKSVTDLIQRGAEDRQSSSETHTWNAHPGVACTFCNLKLACPALDPSLPPPGSAPSNELLRSSSLRRPSVNVLLDDAEDGQLPS